MAPSISRERDSARWPSVSSSVSSLIASRAESTVWPTACVVWATASFAAPKAASAFARDS